MSEAPNNTRRALAAVAIAVGMTVAGCGDGAGPVAPDLGPPPQCSVDVQCSDGEFCNGAERCAPTDSAADSRGCAPALAGPCLAGQTCDEVARVCVTTCSTSGDADGDGRDSADCGGDDCDDSDANRFPGNIEVCDDAGHDEDCNDGTVGARDLDGDGAIDAACCNGDACGTDCDDTDGTMRPGSVEACDGLDNDCDGATDEGVDTTFYVDADGDGYGEEGSAGVTIRACRQPTGYSLNALDCDDGVASVNPAAFDQCDGAVDDDCSGVVDDPQGGCDCTPGATRACPLPGACGTGSQSCIGGFWGPCSIYSLPESCDGADNDCDGVPDTGCTCAPGSTVACGIDVGACSPGVRICGADGTFSPCVAAVGPVAEVCNSRDDDCDGMTDEGAAELVWYRDTDGDGVGVAEGAQLGCIPPALTGWSPIGGDCAPDDPARLCEGYDSVVLSHEDLRAMTAVGDTVVVVGASYGGRVGYGMRVDTASTSGFMVQPLDTSQMPGPIDDIVLDSVFAHDEPPAFAAGGTGVFTWDMDFVASTSDASPTGVRVAYGNIDLDQMLDPVVWSAASIAVYYDSGAGFTPYAVGGAGNTWVGGGYGIGGAAEAPVFWTTGTTLSAATVDASGTVSPSTDVNAPHQIRDCASVGASRVLLCATDGGVYVVDFDTMMSRLVSLSAPARVRARPTMMNPDPDILVMWDSPPRLERWLNPGAATATSFQRVLIAEVAARDAALVDVDQDGDLDVAYITDSEVHVVINTEGL